LTSPFRFAAGHQHLAVGQVRAVEVAEHPGTAKARSLLET
jgi:hypothetical protein